MNQLSVPIFTGENYHIWSVKMKAFMKAYGLWRIVENGQQEPPALSDDATLQQIKDHENTVAKGFKAMTLIHSALSEVMFTRIMVCESAKEAWDKLKEEFQGSDRTRRQQVLNLRREFEMLRMKETKSIKEYIDRITLIVNQIKILGEDFSDRRIVEKVILTIQERFE